MKIQKLKKNLSTSGLRLTITQTARQTHDQAGEIVTD